MNAKFWAGVGVCAAVSVVGGAFMDVVAVGTAAVIAVTGTQLRKRAKHR